MTQIYLRKTTNLFSPEVWSLSVSYDGPIALVKGDQDARDQAKQNAAFAKEVQGDFSKRFGMQTDMLNFLNKGFEGLFSQYQEIAQNGFMPGQEAALRTQVAEQNAGAYQGALTNFQDQAFALGGRDLPSGALMQGEAGIRANEAANEATGQRQVSLFGANQRMQGLAGEGQVLGGLNAVANTASPNSLAQTGVEGGHSAVQDLNATTPTSMLGSILSGIAGGVANSFLPGFGSGLSGFLNGKLFGGGGSGVPNANLGQGVA